jgi:hypothetical protein
MLDAGDGLDPRACRLLINPQMRPLCLFLMGFCLCHLSSGHVTLYVVVSDLCAPDIRRTGPWPHA